MPSQALKRSLAPEEVARSSFFLRQMIVGAITNQCYVVDGGWV